MYLTFRGASQLELRLTKIERNIREAIEFHLDGLREDGLSIPIPSTVVEYCELAAA
jgi:predicted RNase H-like HicB family nuclease